MWEIINFCISIQFLRNKMLENSLIYILREVLFVDFINAVSSTFSSNEQNLVLSGVLNIFKRILMNV